MLSSPRHPVCRTGLKSLPILAVLARADTIDRINFGVIVVVRLCPKLSGSVIESANPPDDALLRKTGDAGHSEHKQQARFTHSQESHRAFHHFGWYVILPGRCGSSIHDPIARFLES